MQAGEAGGVQSVYDFWLGLLPQFFAQLGAPVSPIGTATAASTELLPFPADQVAKAAAITRDALHGLAQSYVPMLRAAGAPALLGQWATALALAPEASMMAPAPAVQVAALMPLQQMQQAWLAFGKQFLGDSPQTLTTAFDRTFGAVSDALGFGPMRQLQAAGQALMIAAVAQNEARAGYAMLVQRAFAAGLETLLQRLADKARAGERIDSMLALLRLWAQCAEQAVHAELQSEQGLAATAAVMRSGLAYRRKMQELASIVAEALDLASRRDLDEAHREIQELKRALRKLRPPVVVAPAEKPAPARRPKRKTS
jgi:hypothetical protein